MILEVVSKGMDEYTAKLEDMKETKTWITEEERKDVSDKMEEIMKWLKEQLDAQEKVKLHEDPIFYVNDVSKRMNALKKLFNKVNNKRKPKPPKKEKKEEKEEEEFADEEPTKEEENKNEEQAGDDKETKNEDL